jgi:hypothetical protein
VKRLRVAQRHGAARRLANVREDDRARRDVVLLQKLDPRTARGALRVTDKQRVPPFVKGEPPTVLVRAGAAAVSRELVEGQVYRRGESRRQG